MLREIEQSLLADDGALLTELENSVVPASAAGDFAPEHSEESLALRFSEQHRHELRYVSAWGRWMVWDGHRWQSDSTLSVFDRARAICRNASSETSQAGTALRLAQARTVAAIEHLARCDRRHAATVDQWDADAWLLNTPAGAVDLRTGKMRPADRTDYSTKITAAAPDGDCPRWRKFLDRVLPDEELQKFTQNMLGYALTGSTREHALFFLHGPGGNGKSVVLQTISGILNDYARTAPIETFIASRNENHPTDLAGLQGARMVTAIETENGRCWAESKIKALTGGDRITARFMRQDFFEFTPAFKLVIAGNHKPGLRTVDHAMRRRMNILPFTVTIQNQERDVELAERLREEWGGILRWMLDGCLSWQNHGLQAPAAVREATDQYLAGEDTVARWIEDECVTQRGSWTSAGALFQNWSRWCETNRENPGSQRKFTQNLESKGIESKRTNTARGFANIVLRSDS